MGTFFHFLWLKFVYLQVTKQQKTPQKKKETVIDDTINNNPSDAFHSVKIDEPEHLTTFIR
jgi:hypothetical protein